MGEGLNTITEEGKIPGDSEATPVQEPSNGYYEDKAILSIEHDDENVTMTFDGGEVLTVKNWDFNATITTEKSDASEGRNRRAIVVVDAIYSLLKGMDVSINEIEFTMQKLKVKMQGTETAAILKCFGKTDFSEMRLSDWESKL